MSWYGQVYGNSKLCPDNNMESVHDFFISQPLVADLIIRAGVQAIDESARP